MTETIQEVSGEVASSVDAASSAHVTTNNVEYRTYGGYNEQGKMLGFKVKELKKADGSTESVTEFTGNPAVLSETQTKKNWEAAEKAGATILNRNQFKFYTLTDEAGLAALVTSPTQRLYIIQKGIDAIQTAAANRYATAVEEKKEKDDPDVLSYNEETIDLLEALNKPPEKKNLTDQEKFLRAVGVIAPDKLGDMIEQLKRMLEAQGASA